MTFPQVDSSLSVLARKLRMIGIDTAVAGEVSGSGDGLRRVPSMANSPSSCMPSMAYHWRSHAHDGR